jgi:ABC-2 type transport system ATP-binding protein
MFRPVTSLASSAPRAALVRASGICKRYTKGPLALQDFTLDLYMGEIVCLLGPNGAGKTTASRIIGTQLAPDEGDLFIRDTDALSHPERVRGNLAMLPQDAMPTPGLTVWENVYYYLRARGLSRSVSRERTADVIDKMDLSAERNRSVTRLSGGTCRRVLLAMVLASEADVILLDEPTSGVDPIGRRKTWELLRGLARQRAVLITTHTMDEADALADRVAIVSGGRILTYGPPAHLVGQLHSRHKIRIVADKQVEELFSDCGYVEELDAQIVVYPLNDHELHRAVRIALAQGIEFSISSVGLEDVYLSLVRKSALVQETVRSGK